MKRQRDQQQPSPLPFDLYAWVGQEGAETGVARLLQADTSLGTINLVAFSREVLAHPELHQRLQEQANRDGQTVRLIRFGAVEEILRVEPHSNNGEGGVSRHS